jgi:hypothetical protein
LGSWQVIGEGDGFLTVKVDLPREMARGAEIAALVLDHGGAPLRHVTGYAFRPELPARDHLWFFFCLYSPREIPEQMRRSAFLRFSFTDRAGAKVEKSVAYDKSWHSGEEAKIHDLPAPPDEIEGLLVLKDYAFLARGDPRKPDGYYVEGKIGGENGRWTHLQVTSDIKGKQGEPEIRIESNRGWIELSSGATHGMQEAVAPASPYVKGWWDGKGYFHPDPPQVY